MQPTRKAHSGASVPPVQPGSLAPLVNHTAAERSEGWSAILPHADACIFPFDSTALPNEFRSYEQFRQVHAARIGRVVRYTR